jgi:hypothetical protein
MCSAEKTMQQYLKAVSPAHMSKHGDAKAYYDWPAGAGRLTLLLSTPCCLPRIPEAVEHAQQLGLVLLAALALLAQALLLQGLVLLYLAHHHLCHVGQHVAALSVKRARLAVNDAAAAAAAAAATAAT